MAKAGRKRKACAREPNGRPSRAESDRAISPALVKRIIERAQAGAADPRLGSVVGRMLLAGDLSARQASAAWRWGEIAAAYAQAIHCPSVRPAVLVREHKGYDPDEISDAGQAMIERDRRAVRLYDRASAVLDACGAGGGIVRALAQDVPPVCHADLMSARVCLDALASSLSA